MKRKILFILILALAYGVKAENLHTVSVGLRGGGQMWQSHTSAVTGRMGMQGGAEVDYAFLFGLKRDLYLGPWVGARITYGSSQLNGHAENTFNNIDYLGHDIRYTTSADVLQKITALQVEVPVMAALSVNGFMVKAGVSVAHPLRENINQSLSNAHIEAYYTQYKVPVVDVVATGKLTRYSADIQQRLLPQWQLSLEAEVGYEFLLGNDDRLGVMAGVSYPLWNSYRVSQTGKALIQVDNITNRSNPAPKLTVNPLQQVTDMTMSQLQVGVHLYYAFSIMDRSSIGWHRYKAPKSHNPYQSVRWRRK